MLGILLISSCSKDVEVAKVKPNYSGVYHGKMEQHDEVRLFDDSLKKYYVVYVNRIFDTIVVVDYDIELNAVKYYSHLLTDEDNDKNYILNRSSRGGWTHLMMKFTDIQLTINTALMQDQTITMQTL